MPMVISSTVASLPWIPEFRELQTYTDETTKTHPWIRARCQQECAQSFHWPTPLWFLIIPSFIHLSDPAVMGSQEDMMVLDARPFKGFASTGLVHARQQSPWPASQGLLSHPHSPQSAWLFQESTGVLLCETSSGLCFKHWGLQWVDCSNQQRNHRVGSVPEEW